jgi:pimeloyl-ACP methyl ester carboxylesterase
MYAFIRALGIERASIYGGSMGAGTALMLALAHPEVVERLILMSPPPFGDDMRRARRMFGALALLYQLLGTHVASSVVSALPPARRLTTPDQRHELRSFLSNQRRAAIVPAIRGLLYGPQIPLDRLSAITQPAVVLTHPDDPIHPLASGKILRERMPHAKLAVAPAPTYWDEHPDEVTRLVSAYVRGEPIEDAVAELHHDQARA